MRMHRGFLSLTVALTAVAALAPGQPAAAVAPGQPAVAPGSPDVVAAAGAWVDGWAAAPHSSAAETTVPTFSNQSVRMVVRLHAGGNAVRIRLSNTFGDRPVTFGRASVGVRGSGAAVPAVQPVTFAGKPGVTVTAGAETSSDVVSLAVRAGQDLAVSVKGSLVVAEGGRPARRPGTALRSRPATCPRRATTPARPGRAPTPRRPATGSSSTR